MPSIPRSVIENYTASINAITKQQQKELAKLLETVPLDNPDAVVETVSLFMRTRCRVAATEAATLAAEVYNAVRVAQLGAAIPIVPDPLFDEAATDAASRGILYKYKNAEAIAAQLAGRIDYEVKQGAFLGMFSAARNDKAKPRFARVPSGNETCDFCIMLASRGAVYLTAKSAGANNHWHASCDCRVVPEFSSEWGIAGYKPDELRASWKGGLVAKAEAAAARNGTTADDEYKKRIKQLEEAARRAHKRSYQAKKLNANAAEIYANSPAAAEKRRGEAEAIISASKPAGAGA